MFEIKRMASGVLCGILCLAMLAACGDKDGSGADSSRVTDVSITVPMPASSLPQSESLPPQSLPQSLAPSSQQEPSSSEPQPQPAPKFLEGSPSVSSVDGLKVTLSLKTDVPSTVNCILSGVADGITTAQFYDYTRRGKTLRGAISHTSAHMVDENGKTLTLTLPDASGPYFVYLNAAENATGTWQSTVTVLQIFDPRTSAAEVNGPPKRQADTAGEYVWQVETTRVTRVYIGITAAGATAPTAADLKAGGSRFTVAQTLDTAGTAFPFTAKLSIPKASLPAGSYTMWLVAQDNGDYPFGTVVKMDFTI